MGKIAKLSLWIRRHLLLVIVILAALLRLTNLSHLPAGLNWDEVSMGYSAYALEQTGRDEWGEKLPLLFRSYGEWKSPLYIYLLVPFVKVFGLNAWAVRLPAALAGILAVYLTYLIGKKLYSDRVGKIAAFLLAVSPWHVMLSRPGFEAGVALTLLLLGLYLFLMFSTSKSIWSLVGATTALGLTLHTYHSAKIVMPLLFLFLLYVYRKSFSKKYFIVAVLVMTVFVLPIAADLVSGKAQRRYTQVGITTDAELVERFYNYRKTLPLGDLGGKLVINKATFFVLKGFSNWTSYLSPHFLLGSESIRAQHSIPFRGVLYVSEFVFVILGCYVLLKKRQSLALYLPLLVIAVGFIPPALTKDAYHVLRSILTLPWWQILAALGIVYLQDKKVPHLKIGYTILIIEILIFICSYFFWYPKAFARDWQYGYQQVSEYAAQNEHKYDQIVFTKTYGEPQIFVAFYTKMDPRIYQEASKSWLSYQDLGLPWLDQLKSYNLGKYTFTDIRYMGGNNHQTLYVGKSDDFWADTPILQKIDFPDKTNAFTVTDGQ